MHCLEARGWISWWRRLDYWLQEAMQWLCRMTSKLLCISSMISGQTKWAAQAVEVDGRGWRGGLHMLETLTTFLDATVGPLDKKLTQNLIISDLTSDRK